MRRLHVPDQPPMRRRFDLDNSLVWEMVLRDYRQGASVKRIAERYGVVRSSIDLRLRRSGITPRSRSDAERMKWQQMPPRRRAKQVEAAHQATRGVPKSLAHKTAHARTTEARANHTSPLEIILLNALKARGCAVRQQTAIGPYNCDLTIDGVAVEVFGGQWHFYGRHAERLPERTRYILDRGWPMIFVVVNRQFPIGPRLADEIIAHADQMRRDPALATEYRVIRGDGQFLTSGRADDAEITIVPTLRQAKRLRAAHQHLAM